MTTEKYTPEYVDTETQRIIAKATGGDTLEMIETFFRVQSKEMEIVPMKLKPAQLDYWGKRTSHDVIIKAAQMGISTEVICEYVADAFVIPNIEVLITAQRDESVKELFQIVTTIQDALPEGLRAKATKSTEHSLIIDHSDVTPGAMSRIQTGTILSKSIGRGRPRHRVLFTEVGFYPPEALPAISGVLARMPRGYSRVVMESTANGQAGYLFNLWTIASGGDVPDEERAMLPQVAFTPHFFPWFWAPEYRITFNPRDPWGGRIEDTDDVEEWLRREHDVDDDQIRWRRFKVAELTEDMFKQEFPQNPDEAFLPVGSSVFKPSLIDANSTHVKPPLFREMNGLLVWKTPEIGRPYIISVDIASGEQRDPNNRPLDFSAVTVWDSVTLEQMETFRRRDVTSKELAKIVADIAKIYNDGLVVPESNLAKFGFMEWLLQFGVRHLYMHLNPNSKPGMKSATMGYPMNRATKPALVDNFRDILEVQGGCTIRSDNLIREMRNYRFLNLTGLRSMGAPPGGNDDELITGLIAFDPEVRSQANSLRGRLQQGVDRRRVSSAPAF